MNFVLAMIAGVLGAEAALAPKGSSKRISFGALAVICLVFALAIVWAAKP